MSEKPTEAEEPVLAASMEPLPVIPTPFSARWREFRIRVVPFIMFALAIAGSVFMWRYGGIGAGGVPGIGEGVRSQISSAQPGVLEKVLVKPYEFVQAGDPVAIILPTDPGARIDLVRTELDIARLKLMPTLAEENAVSYERLRFELLRTKSELAVAQVHLLRAESEVKRSEPLFQEKLLSEDLFELAVNTRDLYRTEVNEKSNVVVELERHLGDLKGLGMTQNLTVKDPRPELATRLDRLYEAASTNWGPVTLRAPISGMVYAINRQQGENVAEGEPLVVINAPWSDRIVGYLRQPYPVDIAPGMKVRITTREQRRRQFWSEVSQVGAHVEVITNALAFVRQGTLVDAGLPITIELPEELKLRPGEVVDLAIMGKAPRKSSGEATAMKASIASK
jgi:multidrug resistance efflux pump